MNEQKFAQKITAAVEKIEERIDALSLMVSALAAELSEDAKAHIESDLLEIKRDVGTLRREADAKVKAQCVADREADKARAQVAHILFLGVKAIFAMLIMGLVWFVW